MPLLINPKSTFDYILEEDRQLPDGHPGKTVFKLRVLTVGELAAVEDSLIAINDDEASVKSGTHTLIILKMGLTGWDNANALDEDATAAAREENPDAEEVYCPVQFETRPSKGSDKVPMLNQSDKNRPVPKNAVFDRLQPKDRKELANAITEQNRLTKEELGN